MDYRRQFKRLAHVGRFLALFFTCLACITFLIWRYMPERINRLDEWIVAKYTGPYEIRLQKAVEDIERGEEASGIHQLEALLDDLEQIKNRDRLDPVKRKSFQVLANALFQTDHYQQAIERFDQWIAFDGNDIDAKLGKARIMSPNPEYAEEGEAYLTELLQTFPHPAVLSPYIQRNPTSLKLVDLFLALDEQDETPEALARAFVDWASNRHRMLQNWRFLPSVIDGFQKDEAQTVSPEWQDHITLRFSVELPRDIQGVFIAPPVGNLIVNPVFQVRGQDEIAATSPSDHVLRSKKMAQPWEGVFLPAWETTPYFTRKIEEQEMKDVPLIGIFQARIFPTLILYITDNEQATAVQKELAAMGGEKLASFFSRIWALWQERLPAQGPDGQEA